MNEKKSNIPPEILGNPDEPRTPGRPLDISPQDPETAKAVNEFLRQKSAEVGGGEPDSQEQGPIESKPIQIQPNPEFEGLNPQDASISSALITDINMPVSMEEREIFLKAVLNDEPVRFHVDLYNGKFRVEMRSRSTFEQRRIFDVLDLDEKEGIISKGNVADMVTRMHYYLAVLMVERINGKAFSDVALAPGEKLEESAKKLRDQAELCFGKSVTVRWNSILNALQTFENKCAKMNTEALNEGFWKPPGSGL